MPEQSSAADAGSARCGSSKSATSAKPEILRAFGLVLFVRAAFDARRRRWPPAFAIEADRRPAFLIQPTG